MNIKDHSAYTFWEKEMGDEKHLIHCSAVINAALAMIQHTNLEPEIIIIAGWIHDMGKLTDKKNHHVESLTYLETYLKEHEQYRAYEEQLKDCILNHRRGGTPTTIYGQIMQVADKVALKDKRWIEYKRNLNTSK